MPVLPEAIAQNRPSWRAKDKNENGQAKSRKGRRVVVGLFGLGLVVLFVVLLAQPYWHPRVELASLSGSHLAPGANQDVLTFDQRPYARQDLGAFAELATILGRSIDDALSLDGRQASLEPFWSDLDARASSGADVVVIYVTADGYSRDGRAFLRWTVDDQSGTTVDYPLRNLLRRVAANAAPAKLLVLDYGQVTSDARNGILLNEFASLLEDELESDEATYADSGLWVLTSHSGFEVSHRSPVLLRSVFSHFVVAGLEGAADLNEDRSIDVLELHRYVSESVQSWVKDTFGEALTQTPQLLVAGSADVPTESPVVIPVVRRKPTKSDSDEDGTDGGDTKAAAAAAQSLAFSAGVSVPTTESTLRETPVGRTQSRIQRTQRATEDASAAAERSAGSETSVQELPEDDATNEDGGETAAETIANDDTSTESNGATDNATAESTATAGDEESDASPVPGLLIDGWRLRDRLARAADERSHRLVVELTQRLQQFERLFRTNALEEDDWLKRGLVETIASFDTQSDPPANSQLADRVRQSVPEFLERVASPRSLGLAELLADAASSDEDSALSELATRLDSFANASEEDATDVSLEFRRWARELTPDMMAYAEVRFARELAHLVGKRPWSVIQRALATRRLAEQVASLDLHYFRWVKNEIEAADRSRWAAERILLDGITPSAAQEADLLLADALRGYRQAVGRLALVGETFRLADELWAKLPDYLRWYETTHQFGDPECPRFEDLESLMATLGALAKLQVVGEGGNHAALLVLLQSLEATKDRLERGLSKSAIRKLASGTPNGIRTGKAQALLATGLVPAEARMQLLTYLSKLPEQAGDAEPGLSNTATSGWQRQSEVAVLHLHLAELAATGLPGKSQRVLQQSRERIVATKDEESEEARAIFRAAGKQLESFYRRLPELINQSVEQHQDLSAPETRRQAVSVLLSCQRAISVLTPLQATTVTTSVPGLLRDSATYDLLAWHMARWQNARNAAPRALVSVLDDAIGDYRRQANAIPNQPPVGGAGVVQVDITGPSELRLSSPTARNVELTVSSRASNDLPVWLVLEYDKEALEVSPLDRLVIHPIDAVERAMRDRFADDAQSPSHTTESAVYPYQPQDGDLPASLVLSPGQQTVLRFHIRAIRQDPDPQTVIVRVVTPEHDVRHDIVAALPVPETLELRVSGPNGAFAPVNDGYQLFPFPNRNSEYGFELANSGKRDRNVTVALFHLNGAVAALPRSELPPTVADRLIGQNTMGPPIVQTESIAIPARGSAPIAFPELGSSDSDSGEQGADTADNEADGELEGTALNGDLLLVINDAESSRQLLKRIRIATQQPRRLLKSRVDYDARSARVHVELKARDRDALPIEPMKVQLEVLPPPPEDADALLEAEITPDNPNAELFAVVARDAATVKVHVHVDGYPRAFRYELAPTDDSVDLSEDSRPAIEIVSPDTGTALLAPVNVVPVEAKVDIGVLRTPDQVRIDVGIDRDRDRELRGEPTVRLPSDRQIRMALVKLTPQGHLTIGTTISDFFLKVPAPAVKKAVVNVLGRIATKDANIWSRSIRITLDGSPPLVGNVAFGSGRTVLAGSEMIVSAAAHDEALSGVEGVEFGIDPKGDGEFTEDVTPVAGEQLPDGRWSAKIPTEELPLGPQLILVRAKDQLGNVSRTITATFEVASAEEIAERRRSITAKVQGSVGYRTSQVAAAKVTLTSIVPPDEEPVVIGPIVADKQGRFQFPRVPIGSYRISATAVVRNRERKASDDIVVKKALPPLKLLLR